MVLFILQYKKIKQSIKKPNNFDSLVKEVRQKFNLREEIDLKFEFYLELKNSNDPIKIDINDNDTYLDNIIYSNLNECHTIRVNILTEDNRNDVFEKIKQLEEKNERLELKYSELSRKLEILIQSTDDLQNMKEEINNLKKKIISNETKKYEELFLKFISLEKKINESKDIQTILNLKKTVKDLKETIEFLSKENKEKNRKINYLENEINNLKKKKTPSEITLEPKHLNLIRSSLIKNQISNKNVLSCKFIISEKNKQRIKRDEIEKDSNIPFNIEVINNGGENITWPNDTFIRCINDDSDIYFNSSKTKFDNIDRNNNVHTFYRVNVKFKNYLTITPGEHIARCKLISDSQGDIGDEIGHLSVVIED